MIKVDENTCIGCGACTYIDEETFAMNDKGVSTAIAQNVTDTAIEAANACPVGAISVTDEGNVTNIADVQKEQEEQEDIAA